MLRRKGWRRGAGSTIQQETRDTCEQGKSRRQDPHAHRDRGASVGPIERHSSGPMAWRARPRIVGWESNHTWHGELSCRMLGVAQSTQALGYGLFPAAVGRLVEPSTRQI